jgi:thiol-disulfide isomerase/thioredoxin
MRPPVDTIAAPSFPRELEWVNVAPLRMDKQHGRPVLVEFWDFCRPNSLRTLPYLRAWHERYAAEGLRVIGVHTPGFPPSQDPAAVRAAVARLGIEHPVVLDGAYAVWDLYENPGWPARYLFGPDLTLVDVHLGEGAYAETERAIQAILGVDREPVAPLRPEDRPDALLAAQTEDQPGPWSGPYEAGGVWGVLSGRGTVTANGRALTVEQPGAYPLVEHPRHTAGELALEVGPGVACHAVCFTPGVVEAPAPVA